LAREAEDRSDVTLLGLKEARFKCAIGTKSSKCA
jgi:hypothetical protein